MEEKFNIKDNKVFVGSIVGVLVLILLTVGATYAYFTFNADNQFGTQTIEATTEAIGSGVVLTKVGDGLTLDVSASEMLEENIGTNYYASGSEEPATIGKISVTGDGTYTCSYTMKVTKTSTTSEKDLYERFQNFDNKSDGQIYLSINDTKYDFNTSNLFPIEYTNNIVVNNAEEKYITANMVIANTNIDQTILNDADISIQFEVTEFNCELYKMPTNGLELIENPTTGLDTTTSYNGMYRYIGTTADNYVDIGGVSYRIIGITSEANSTLGLEVGQLKVIKTDSIGTYNWHTSHTTDTKWEASAMYTYLNNTVLNDTTYIPSDWPSKIDSVKWYVGDVNTTSLTNANTIIGLEDDTVTSNNSKIGLMYLSDYYYSEVAEGTTNCFSIACTTSWIYNSSTDQWTMTRYGYRSDNSYYAAWRVGSDGYFGRYYLTYENYVVRPTFYLTSDVQFVSGSGTSSDPFILE